MLKKTQYTLLNDYDHSITAIRTNIIIIITNYYIKDYKHLVIPENNIISWMMNNKSISNYIDLQSQVKQNMSPFNLSNSQMYFSLTLYMQTKKLPYDKNNNDTYLIHI